MKENLIIILCIVLCGLVFCPVSFDNDLTIRHIIFGLCTLLLSTSFIYLNIKRLPRLLYVFVGYFLISGLSIIWATNKGEAAYEAARVFMWLTFLLAFYLYADTDKIIKTVIGLALAFGIYALFQYSYWCSFHNISKDIPYQCVGFMSHRNLWCEGMVLLLPFCIYGFKYSKLWKFLSVSSFLLVSITLCLLFARAAFIALISILFITGLYRHKAKIAISFMVLLCIVCALKWRFITNGDSLNQRQQIWTCSLRLIRDNPFGVGAGNWKIEIPKYAHSMTLPDVYTKNYFRAAHNDFIETFAELGIAGGLIYAGLFGFTIYYAIKKRNVLVLTGIIAYIIIANFSFPKERAFHCLILLIYMGIACKGSAQTLFVNPFNKKVCPQYLFALILLGQMLSLYVYAERFKTDCNMRKVLIAATPESYLDAAFQLGNDYSCFASLDSATWPVLWYVGVSHYRVGEIESAKRMFWKAYKNNPNHVYVLNNLAAVLGNTGRLNEALIYFDKANLIRGDVPVVDFNIKLNDSKKQKNRRSRIRK